MESVVDAMAFGPRPVVANMLSAGVSGALCPCHWSVQCLLSFLCGYVSTCSVKCWKAPRNDLADGFIGLHKGNCSLD